MNITLTKPLIYVTRDIERALGLDLDTANYYIITNATPFAKTLAHGRTNIVLIKHDEILSTRELLAHESTTSFINTLDDVQVVVFKSSPRIEQACQTLGATPLNPPTSLTSNIENKIEQIDWLGELATFLPDHTVTTLGDAALEKTTIAQFNRGHTGSSTFLIDSEHTFESLQDKFPNRPVRLMDYIDGPTYTRNMIIGDHVLLAPISYQITGTEPFTDQPFATVGNDWITAAALSDSIRTGIDEISVKVGEKLQASGFIGACGLDVIVDEKGRVYLIEINARQPASVTTESSLQHEHTTFEAHIAALTKQSLSSSLDNVSGAQIIARVTSKNKEVGETSLGQQCIPGTGGSLGSELIRVISDKQLCAENGILTAEGKSIESTLYR